MHAGLSLGSCAYYIVGFVMSRLIFAFFSLQPPEATGVTRFDQIDGLSSLPQQYLVLFFSSSPNSPELTTPPFIYVNDQNSLTPNKLEENVVVATGSEPITLSFSSPTEKLKLKPLNIDSVEVLNHPYQVLIPPYYYTSTKKYLYFA